MYAEIRERRAAPDLAERTDVLSRLILRRRRAGRRRSPTRSCATSWSRCCSPATRPPRPRWPGRSTRSAATPSSGARARDGRRRRRRRLARGGAQGVDAAAPGDPDGGAHADEAGHHRRHRPAGRRHRRAVDPDRPRPRGQPPRPRASSGPSGSSARTRPPTPGSRSAAAYAAASAPASR